MNSGRTLFAQLMDFVSPYEFRKCVERYQGHHKVHHFTCWEQFLCMAFAQLTYRESLRDIQACLRGAQPKLYHMGLRSPVARNTLAHANEVRDWRIAADFAQGLIATARTLYAAEAFGVELDEPVYALDATVIDLCLALFPWAKFRKRKAAVKLHTLLDLRGNIPTVLFITPGRVHDVNILDQLVVEPSAFYILDRGYVDFARLYRLHQARGFFVTRAKRNFRFRDSRFATSGPDQRRVLGSAHPPVRLLQPPELSRAPAAHPVLRCREGQMARVLDQQLRAARAHHRPALQMPLAGRTVLQMDQAAPTDQGLLRHLRERREDPNLDRHRRVRAGCHHQEAAPARGQSLLDPPDSQRLALRENPSSRGTYDSAKPCAGGR